MGATDLSMLEGNYLFAPKTPFVPGYELAGVVDAIGPGVTNFRLGQRVAALTVYGGFAEFLTRTAGEFLPIPDAVSDCDAAAVILNYVTAWQMIHRVAKVRPGETALVTGAAGGVGTAALQLLRLVGLKTYGSASAGKHEMLRSLGATPIDYRTGRLDRLTRDLEPEGVDYVFDAVGAGNIGACIGALHGEWHSGWIWFHGRSGCFQADDVQQSFRGGATARAAGILLWHHSLIPEGPKATTRRFAEDLCASRREEN